MIPDHIMRWLGPAVVCVIGGMVIFGNPISQRLICDGTQNCLATWVGALSGWAALAGALLTIGVMREQLAEQKRQSDHIMGEHEPEMYLSSDLRGSEDAFEWKPMLVINVSNRNRRRFQTSRFEFQCDTLSADIFVHSIEDADGTWEQPIASKLRTRYAHRSLAGKVEGAAPAWCKIYCYVSLNGNVRNLPRDTDEWINLGIKIRLHGFLEGAKSQSLFLEAETAMGV